jgi:hypothetical protein
MCAFEQATETRRRIRRQARSCHVLLDDHGVYRPQVGFLFRAGEELRQWRERTVMNRFREMVEEVKRMAVKNSGPCCRDKYFSGGRRGGFGALGDFGSTRLTYKVVDRRGESLE